jgi:heavy metal sensor kinase
VKQSWSLRLRLTLLVGLLTGGAVLLFAAIFYIKLESNLVQEIDARLRERAALVADALRLSGEHFDETPDLPALPPLAEFDAPGIYVELLDADGVVRATSPNLGADRLPARPELVSAVLAGATTTETVPAGGDEDVRLLASPIHLVTAPAAILLVAESVEPLERTLDQARTLLLACGVIAVLLATAGAALLTGRALAPVARLTHAAAGIAATGRYEERVPAPQREDEIGQLAATINELIATLERAIGQQRQFLADTSHELRSPLTVILANLDLLRRDLDQIGRQISVEEAIAEAQRMRKLVNDLLLLAQADAAQAIAQAPVRLDRLVEDIAAAICRQAHGHTIHAQIDTPVLVMGDRDRLTQLVRNLLENATLHTPAGTTIDVRLRRSEGQAELIVADTGPGIATEHLPRVWDRFYRIDKARSRSQGGTGLGLAIVKYIAEAHGGRAEVTSQVGAGAAFTIVLPLAPADASPSGKPATAPIYAGQSVADTS